MKLGIVLSSQPSSFSAIPFKEGIEGTDDAYFVERMGMPVKVIEGSSFNIKITTPEDIALAHYILREGKVAEGASI